MSAVIAKAVGHFRRPEQEICRIDECFAIVCIIFRQGNVRKYNNRPFTNRTTLRKFASILQNWLSQVRSKNYFETHKAQLDLVR